MSESVTESLCQTTPPVFDSQRLSDSNHGKGNRQQTTAGFSLREINNRRVRTPLKLEMTERKAVPGAAPDCEQRNVSNTDPEEEEKGTCAAEDSARTWQIPSLQELEEILHSAPRSCRHGDEVWPNLYLGDMFMSHDRLGLWQLGITHVLNAAHGKLCCKGSDDFYGTTVKYYGVPANDLPTFDLSPFFYPAAEFIHWALTSGGKVFVHCAVGVSRSAALVLAYLMIHHHLSLLSSVRCVQQKRWIFPNRGFLRQLIALDHKLQDEGLNEAK